MKTQEQIQKTRYDFCDKCKRKRIISPVNIGYNEVIWICKGCIIKMLGGTCG